MFETEESKFTHFDKDGNAVMVDVTGKDETVRVAVAKGKIIVSCEIIDGILQGTMKKGDVLGVARIAGIMAAKNTFSIIPLCHMIPLTKCTIDFNVEKEKKFVEAVCTVKTSAKTGVEMEALTGVQVALLTIYDMCKAVDKGMIMTDIHLENKSGGKSGDFTWKKN